MWAEHYRPCVCVKSVLDIRTTTRLPAWFSFSPLPSLFVGVFRIRLLICLLDVLAYIFVWQERLALPPVAPSEHASLSLATYFSRFVNQCAWIPEFLDRLLCFCEAARPEL